MDDDDVLVGQWALALGLIGVAAGVLVVSGALVSLNWLRQRVSR